MSKTIIWIIGIPLKIISLRCIQMHQHTRMISSMKKGTASWFLSCSSVKNGSSWSPSWSWMLDQHFCGKGQSMKRCPKLASTSWLQQTQFYEGMTIFRCLRGPLVLSLVFVFTFWFPEPIKCRIHKSVSREMNISFRGRKGRESPRCMSKNQYQFKGPRGYWSKRD